jgi:Transglycosylase SLT domain
MFPAICRGRALDSCLLAAVLLSACASTGPGTPPPLAPGIAPVRAPEMPPARTSEKTPARPSEKTPARAAEVAPPRAPAAASRTVTPKRRAVPRARPRTAADSAALEREIIKRMAHHPLAMALARRMRNPEIADRVAAAVVYEAGRARISPSVLAGVLVIENARFDTSVVSTEGAIGLMQVMPMHVGSYRCLSGDLLNVEANICHGARLLHSHLRRAKNIETALRRYNGCVRGRNTPRCQRYPGRVLRTASRLRREVLVMGGSLEANPERRGTTASRLSELPPDIEMDSMPGAANEPAKCDSFLGCLKHRWGRPDKSAASRNPTAND